MQINAQGTVMLNYDSMKFNSHKNLGVNLMLSLKHRFYLYFSFNLIFVAVES